MALAVAPMAEAAKPECSDGKDNDGDGRTDYGSDPDCESKGDTTEAAAAPPPSGTTECSDGLDNALRASYTNRVHDATLMRVQP